MASMSDGTQNQEPGSGHEERVTERLPEQRATERFGPRGEAQSEAAAQAAPPGLARGELVDDRYRVEAGPIGTATGEAEVYRCADAETGETVALKFYRENVSPKAGILDSLLNLQHPDVVTLHAYGAWAGRFYEVMDYCVGGSLTDHMPFPEPTLRGYVSQIVHGLEYLHGQGIIHRDIKPSNLFFREQDREDLVIGDFGVSSILQSDEKVRKTSTGAFFTLDYAAPELIDGKEVSAKTDYYALGVTLLQLLTGVSPFAGMDNNAILGCHFRGNVPRPTELSDEFNRLIDGLLRVSPQVRWGHGQVVSWLEGRAVLTDDGLPDRPEAYAGKTMPYRSLPAITTPAEMAARLSDFDAERDLQRGYIAQWAMFFDTDLGRRIAQLEEDSTGNAALDKLKLRYLLDPTLPLDVGSSRAYDLKQLAGLVDLPHNPYQQELEGLLYGGSIEAWVDARGHDQSTQRLVDRIAAIRTGIKNRPLGLLALLYALSPTRPLRLSQRVSLSSPEDLEDALAQNPKLKQRVMNYLYGGHFALWMRNAFPERVDDVRFITECVTTFRENREQGTFALRCRFCRTLPLWLGAAQAKTPKELAALISRSPASYELGIRLLAEGWIRAWLWATGRLTDLDAFDAVADDPATSGARKLEAVLHMLDPDLLWPRAAADVDYLDGGIVSTDGMKTMRLCVFNAGRGHLSGTITLDDGGAAESGLPSGFSMAEREIEGGLTEIAVTMSGQGLPPGKGQEARIIVDTNGGRLEIPVFFHSGGALWRLVSRALLVGLVAAHFFAFLRLMLQRASPEYALNTMNWLSRDYVAAHPERPSYVPAALLALAGLAAGLSYLVAVYRRNE